MLPIQLGDLHRSLTDIHERPAFIWITSPGGAIGGCVAVANDCIGNLAIVPICNSADTIRRSASVEGQVVAQVVRYLDELTLGEARRQIRVGPIGRLHFHAIGPRPVPYVEGGPRNS